MILLTWSMIRSRGTQALTVMLMAAVAVGAAVAAGVYVNAAQQRVLADDVAAAPTAEKSVTATDVVRLKASPDNQAQMSQLASSRQRAFAQSAPAMLRADGFDTVFAARYQAFIATRPWTELDHPNGVIEYRDSFCDHVVLVRGRCVSGPGEVIVSPARAAAGLGVSQTLLSRPVEERQVRGDDSFVNPQGDEATLVVVGVYEAKDPTDLYWGTSSDDLHTVGAEPVLTDRRTLTGTDHETESQSVTAYLPPASFALDRLDPIRTRASGLVAAAGKYSLQSNINALLDRIDRDNRTVALVAGVATVPLVALCWYVLFLAIAYTAAARRAELGMVKLRGVAGRDQWWIVAAESFTPVFAGALLGYLVGHLAVWAYARIFFGPAVSVGLTLQPVPFAALALAGSVAAGLVAMRRDVASTATELLRRVPTLRRGWRGLSLAGLVCALAALSLYQLRSAPAGDAEAGQQGLGRYAPALLIIGLGLLLAVLVDPLMGWLGGRAMKRGRLGLALAGLHIGRRRSGSRLLSLVVVVVGLLTFAATASQFAGAEREREAGATMGAARVLTVSGKTPIELLNAVRSVDPAGDFAMAAVPIYTGDTTGGNLIAVDAPRLPKVAIWPAANQDMTAQAAAQALHPTLGKPVEVKGTGLAVFAQGNAGRARFPLSLRASVVLLTSGELIRYRLVAPTAAGAPYTTNVACTEGCRLVDLQIGQESVTEEEFRNPPGTQQPELTFHSIRQTGPDRELFSGAQLATWSNRSVGGLDSQPLPDGLKVSLPSVPNHLLPIAPPDLPAELPTLDAGQTNIYSVSLADHSVVPASAAGTPQELPRLGDHGEFTDLEYLVLNGLPQQAGATAEVWLNASAPPDTVTRLQKTGLTVRSSQSLADQLNQAEKRPGAVGLRFLLIVAVFGLLLGAAGLLVAAGVERRSRSEELRNLRVQGVAPGAVATAALVGYVVLVAVAVVLGFGVGFAVWRATGAYLPILDTAVAHSALPFWPGGGTLAIGAAGGLVLIGVAAAIAAFLTRSSRAGTARA
jgi:putative ABC transport system permease protein